MCNTFHKQLMIMKKYHM